MSLKAYVNGSINGMVKSNGYSKNNKYYQSRNEKFNHLKSSININDPNDWPALGEATTENNPNVTSGKLTNRSAISSTDTSGTVFSKKKIVQTKNTSTPNGEIVETTVIEETETFSKLVISKEPSNKDNNNNRVTNRTMVNGNDNESSSETNSSNGANLDDSIDLLDEKENNSKCDSGTCDESGKKKSSDQQSTKDEQANTSNKLKKKSSKSKWKVLNIEQPSRPLMDKRKFERNHRDYRERDYYRDHRDSKISSNKRNKEFNNNSNGKYGESNEYYNRRYNANSSNHNQQPAQKDSQIVNSNVNNISKKEEEKTSNKQTTNNTTHPQTHQQSQSKPSNQSNGYYSNGYHRQKRSSGGFRNNRSISGYRQRNSKMHYDSGNVTPISDYDYNGQSNGYYFDQVPHQQINSSTNSLSHQNSFVAAPAYYFTPNIAAYNPTATLAISRTKWPYLDDSLRNQIEYYFSEENLQRDIFLRRKMDKDGYLPISLIASFHRVQALTLNPKHIIDSLKKSEKVELSEDLKKVRAKNDPSKWAILDPMYNLFEYGKTNSNASSSCNSKDGSSTDSANDSRTSGVSLGSSGTTDLHPNVPDFIPGQPYGYLYDGANTTYGVLYNFPPTSFHPHKSPIENSYTLNYQSLPYSSNAYPLNSTSLTNNCLEEDSKIKNNSDNIIDEVNQNKTDDHFKVLSLPEDKSVNQNDNEKLNNNCESINQSKDNQPLNFENKIVELNEKDFSQVDEDKKLEDNDSANKKEINATELKDEVKEEEKIDLDNDKLEHGNKENSSQILNTNANEEESKINLKEKLPKLNVTKDNSSKENLSSLKKNSKEINNSTSSSPTNNTTSSSKNTVQQTQKDQPPKVLSYSDAIKLKQVNNNNNNEQQSDQQIKKKNDSPNKQAVLEQSHKENNNGENRRDHKKSNEHKKSNKEFHGFRSAKSKNRSSARK